MVPDIERGREIFFNFVDAYASCASECHGRWSPMALSADRAVANGSGDCFVVWVLDYGTSIAEQSVSISIR